MLQGITLRLTETNSPYGTYLQQ